MGLELVYLNGQIFHAPGGASGLRCVARASNGQRCLREVCAGLRGDWTQVPTPHGKVAVYRPAADAATVARWLSQHCRLHARAGTIDAVAREWERFAPRGRHARLLEPATAVAQQQR